MIVNFDIIIFFELLTLSSARAVPFRLPLPGNRCFYPEPSLKLAGELNVSALFLATSLKDTTFLCGFSYVLIQI